MIPSPTDKKSLKKQMVHLLDQFLLGRISVRDLKAASLPMLQISSGKRGRKNYIERILVEISTRADGELTRDYIYDLRETILGDSVKSEKDRAHVFKRTLRKLIERLYYGEIEEPYYLSLLYDLMFEFHEEAGREKEVKDFFSRIQAATPLEIKHSEDAEENEASVVYVISLEFYDRYYKSLWDE